MEENIHSDQSAQSDQSKKDIDVETVVEAGLEAGDSLDLDAALEMLGSLTDAASDVVEAVFNSLDGLP